MNCKKVRFTNSLKVGLCFGIFQALMPFIGWFAAGSLFSSYIEKFDKWIALILLGFIGGKMLLEGIKEQGDEGAGCPVGLMGLLVQAVATSIDALSVGFTISEYGLVMALVCALIIAAVTFIICI